MRSAASTGFISRHLKNVNIKPPIVVLLPKVALRFSSRNTTSSIDWVGGTSSIDWVGGTSSIDWVGGTSSIDWIVVLLAR